MATISEVISSKTVLALSAAIAGTLAGVTLLHPTDRANDVALDIHALRIERPVAGDTPARVEVEIYTSAKWTRGDGGVGSRDLGPSRCAFTSIQNPVAITRLVNLTNAAATRCDAGRGTDWPHVTEVVGTSVNGDAGYALRVYASRPESDGGTVDLGEALNCPPWVGALPTVLENALFKLAVRCAEDRLEELP